MVTFFLSYFEFFHQMLQNFDMLCYLLSNASTIPSSQISFFGFLFFIQLFTIVKKEITKALQNRYENQNSTKQDGLILVHQN